MLDAVPEALAVFIASPPVISRHNLIALNSFLFNREGIKMATGTVKWVNYNKGFGYIKPADGSEDIFFQRHAIKAKIFNSLIAGTRVSFDTDKKEKKSFITFNVINKKLH